MFKLIIIAIIQSGFLAVAQYFMKMATERVAVEACLSWSYIKEYLSWQMWTALILYFIGMIIYLYMLKKYPLSLVYPLTSISYIFTILIAMGLLGESVPLVRWIGMALIMVGVGLIAR